MPTLSLFRPARRSVSLASLTRAVPAVAASMLAACGGGDARIGESATVYEGATVITGEPGEVIENAVFVVEDGRFTVVDAADAVEVPAGVERVDLTGQTVIPALVNAHIHLASDRETRIEQMRHMAYYGATAVLSLGHDDGAVPMEMSGEVVSGAATSYSAGPGITTPEPGRSEVPYWVTTEEEAREAVREMAAAEVDFVKIWVDSRGGQYEKMTPALYSAVIEEAHTHGLQVAAHIFELADAKGLLAAGVDVFAHGIRDMDLDDELLELWRERPSTVLIPNLPGPGVPVDLAWISTVPDEQLSAMRGRQSENPAAQESFGIQARNLDRLSDAGVTIAFGTDGSTPWAVHHEMEDMVRSGMTPAEVLTAATKNSAELMGLTEVGTIAEGMSADFVVLEANPLDDITNTRRIADVVLRGETVDRAAFARQARAGQTP